MSDGNTDAARQTKEALEYVRRKTEREMTPPHQPKEYIITETRLMHLLNELPCQFEPIVAKEIRSRPSPAPAPMPILERFARERGEKVFLIYEGEVNGIKAFCARHGLEWNDNHIRNRNDLQEHDAAIRAEAARQAREDAETLFSETTLERVRRQAREDMAKELSDIIKSEWMCDLSEILYIIEGVSKGQGNPFNTQKAKQAQPQERDQQ